jgi:hypothetical protein
MSSMTRIQVLRWGEGNTILFYFGVAIHSYFEWRSPTTVKSWLGNHTKSWRGPTRDEMMERLINLIHGPLE